MQSEQGNVKKEVAVGLVFHFAFFTYHFSFPSGTGGSRTHTLRGLSSAALPVGVPCLSTRAPSGSRTHTSAMARRQAAATSWAHVLFQVPSFKFQARSLQLGTRNLKPGTFPSGSGGSRTHVVPLKRRAPRRHRPHFHCRIQYPVRESNPTWAA